MREVPKLAGFTQVSTVKSFAARFVNTEGMGQDT